MDEVEKKVKVEIPRTPNFIKVGKDYKPVSFFNERELRAIAREWTKDLLEKKQRQEKYPPDSSGDAN